MKKILITQWFNCKNKVREDELITCINHNLSIGFDQVIIHNDSTLPKFSGDNIINIYAKKRITYKDFLEIVRDPNNNRSLIVLCNTDIKIDKNIFKLNRNLSKKMIALSRYESTGLLAENAHWTQDVWAMEGQPIHESSYQQSDIPLGVPSCELRFAEVLYAVGFKVFNPCLDIKNVHVQSHESVHKDELRMYGAYVFTPSCTIDDIFTDNLSKQGMPFYMPTHASAKKIDLR